MCFKKPRLPPKTAADLEAEKELEDATVARKVQLERDLAMEKEEGTQSALARALGFVGNRSLITGPKGGAGYMGAGSNRMRGRRRISGGVPVASLLAPSQSAAVVASSPSGGGGGGGSGGSGGGAGGGYLPVANIQ
jgi:hypothetical protein